jgi:hypothetical protein
MENTHLARQKMERMNKNFEQHRTLGAKDLRSGSMRVNPSISFAPNDRKVRKPDICCSFCANISIIMTPARSKA